MKLIYSISVNIYVWGIHLASLFNTKARLWVQGRKNFFAKNKITSLHFNTSTNIWFHCASLGEFEMARPLMEELKKRNSSVKIILTFFSPSGYEIRKNYPLADLVCYLPKDSAVNAKKFICAIQPKAAFFAKYEYWYFYLRELKSNNIPCYLISAVFNPNQVFFKWYGGFFRNILKLFRGIYVVNSNSQTQLRQIGINSTIAGDTRFDRVIENAANRKHIAHIETFKQNQLLIVAGSSWHTEEEILAKYLVKHPHLKLVLAPHDISEKHIQEIEKLFSFSKTLRYSMVNDKNVADATVLIIDNIGLLSSLYYYADICIVGGGFRGSLHNILEALVYAKPVLFGDKFKPKFTEAYEALHKQCAFAFSDLFELQKIIDNLLSDKQYYAATSKAASEYIAANTGASKLIFSETLEKYC